MVKAKVWSKMICFTSKILYNDNKYLLTAICFALMWIGSCSSSTCSSSVPSSADLTTWQWSFQSYTQTLAHRIVSGPVSNCLYYLFYISTPANVVIRKLNVDGNLNWMASFNFGVNYKSLAIDNSEQNVYISSRTSPLTVVRMYASTGEIQDQQAL